MTVRPRGQFRDVQSSRGDSERVIATSFPDQCARATCSCGGEGPEPTRRQKLTRLSFPERTFSLRFTRYFAAIYIRVFIPQ